MSRLSIVCLVVIGWLALAGQAQAAAGGAQLTACDPAEVKAGDVVLLTLRGTLPDGNLTVEFFPQRISVLAVQAIDAQTLSVQVSVPLDAPSGAYNVLVYNQKGDEALGGQLLTVTHRVRAPRIISSEPSTVESDLAQIKLTLRCDGADPEMASHLKVDWSQGGRPVDGMNSAFDVGGLVSIGLTLSGEMPVGELLGKVYFDSTPIYLIRLTRVDKDWGLIGHRPSRIASDAPALNLVLIGHGLTKKELTGCTASLLLDTKTVASAPVEWADNATAHAKFAPTPPVGDYTLTVSQGGTVFYQGPFSVVVPGSPPSETTPPSRPTEPGRPAAPDAAPLPGGPALPDWQQAQAVKPAAPPGPDEPAPAAPAPDASAVVLKPASIAVGKGVYRVELHGLQLGQHEPDDYTASLTSEQGEATLMFMGLGADSLVLLFKAPDAGWQTGQDYTLTLVEKATNTPLLAREVPAK